MNRRWISAGVFFVADRIISGLAPVEAAYHAAIITFSVSPITGFMMRFESDTYCGLRMSAPQNRQGYLSR